MRKVSLILVGVLALAIVLVGCGSKKVNTTGNLPGENNISSTLLKDEDFNITYKNIVINDSVPFDQITSKLGTSEDIYQLISTDETMLIKRWSLNYPSKNNPELKIIYLDGVKDTYLVEAILYKIPTNRGLQVGDSLDKLIKLYGNPTEAKDDLYIYKLNSKSLRVNVDKDSKLIKYINFYYNYEKANKEQMGSSGEGKVVTNPTYLLDCMGLTKDELIKKLGKDYKEEISSDEGRTNVQTFLAYQDTGLLYTLSNKDGRVVNIGHYNLDYMRKNLNVKNIPSINGATPGMNFKQIEEKLGKGKIEQMVDTGEGQMNVVIYNLIYYINGNKIIFSSYDKGGNMGTHLIIKKN